MVRLLTSERSEEVPFLRGVGMMCGARGPLRTAVLAAELVLNFGIFGRNLVFWEILLRRTAWRGLFFDGAIWSSTVRRYDAKTGPDRATVHLESSNLVCRQIFSSP